MKRKIWTVIGLLVSILLLTPLLVSAQNLQVAPLSWDFGDVELGTSRSQISTLTSLGPTGVWVYVAEITPTEYFSAPYRICGRSDSAPPGICDVIPEICEEEIACDFAISQVIISDGRPYVPPVELPMGVSVDVEVTFTPSALGSREAFLFIWSNDSVPPPGPRLFIPLTG